DLRGDRGLARPDGGRQERGRSAGEGAALSGAARGAHRRALLPDLDGRPAGRDDPVRAVAVDAVVPLGQVAPDVGMAETIRRLLFIVGSTRPDFYESLRRTFRGDDTVQIVLDRRRGDRRGTRRPVRRTVGREQRGAERREQLEIQRQLRSRGYAVV